MTTTAAPATTSRLLYLDNLRVALTVLVVLHHIAVTYGNIPVWYYTEPAQDPSGGALDVFVSLNQMFFMGFFFMIAGFFSPGAHDRKGGGAFARGRLLRLGVPLAFYLVVLRPLALIPAWQTTSAHVPGLSYVDFYLVSIDPGPMWFAGVLLVFGLGYALWRRFAGPAAPAPTTAPTAAPTPVPTPARAPGFAAIAAFVVGLAATTYVWRLLVPVGTYWPIMPTPSFLPQYLSLFVVGILAFRRGWLAALPTKAAWIAPAALAVVTLVLLPVVALQGCAPAAMAMTLWESTFCVVAIITLLVLFRQRLNGQGRVARFLSDHAFTVYVFHPVVLVALAVAFSPVFAGLHAPAVLRFAVLGVLALPVCWAVAALVRSVPVARRFL